jgi:hypothetical protein
MEKSRNLERVRGIGFGDDPGIVIFNGSKSYISLELPDKTVVKIEVTPQGLNDLCSSLETAFHFSEHPFAPQPLTRFERINQNED